MRTNQEALFALRPVGDKLSEIQKQALLRFQVALEDFTHAFYDNVPDCADRSAAARKLLELKMTAVQAITHTGFEPKTKEKKNVEEKSSEK